MKKKEIIDYKKLVEESDTIFWETDRSGRIVYISKGVQRILGCIPEEFLGKIFPPENGGKQTQESRDAKAIFCFGSPRPFNGMIRPVQHRDGRIVMLETDGRPKFDERGDFSGFTGVSREISLSRRYHGGDKVEPASKVRFCESMIGTLPIRFFWKDQYLRYTDANELFLRDLGYRKLSQIVGKNDFTLAKPDIASVYRQGDFDILLLGREFYQAEANIVTEDGRMRDIALYKSPIKDDRGNIVGVAGAYVDITERKEREKERKEYIDRLNNAQKLAKIGYCDIDLAAGKVFWSDGAYRIFGHDEGKPVISMRVFLRHVMKEDRPKVIQRIREIFRGQRSSYEMTYRIVKNNREIAYLHARAKAVPREGGSVWIRGIIQDITEMKKLQIENEKKQALLMRQSRLVQMGQLLNNIAHQWKQPLAELNALLLDLENDFLEKRLDHSRFERFFGEFEQITSFMGETIENFRKYVTHSTQNHTARPAKAIHEALNLLKQRSKKVGIRYEIDLLEEIETVGSRQDIIHIFLVLLNNAMDAFERNGTERPAIGIRMKKEGDHCEMTVKDNAGGIDETIVEHIFDPYFTTKFQEKGSGIGLFMAKAIAVSRLQGDLELTDYVETTFRLRCGCL